MFEKALKRMGIKTIAIGCDPNATTLKDALFAHLRANGYAVQDFGREDPVYANVAIEVAERVASQEFDRGVLICGTGIGVSIAANKVPGAYAAMTTDVYSVERSILSNNANILTFGAQVIGVEAAKRLLGVWLAVEYKPGGRSAPKVQRIYDYAQDANRQG